MNHIFPILLILPSLFLAAEPANDERSQPGPRDPATGGSAKEARAALKPSAASATAGASATARGPRPLPNESDAVAAAIAAKGGAEYDTRGQVKLIHCDDASDADLRLFAG